MNMSIIANVLVALVALEHLYIAYIEMFSWNNIGKRVFKNTMKAELFAETSGIAANLGLYNAFLAVGLIISYCVGDAATSELLRYIFLGFVITAALYGAYRSDKMILLKQGMPAILALIATLMA